MKLATPRRTEIGSRFRWLRTAAGVTGRDIRHLLGENSNAIATRMEKGESLTIERLTAVAQVLAGQGQLVDDPKLLFDFMVWGGEVTAVLHPHLRPVEANSRPIIASAYSLDAKKEAPEGASVTPSSSTAGSEDQMSYYRNIDRVRECEHIQWAFIPSRSRSRELPPGLRGPNTCSMQGREILTDLA
jgi:transcriptional regulator with XRE-family HTH domain